MSTTIIRPDSPANALSTYRAAVVPDFGSPLTFEQVPKPTLATGQVLVHVEACGLCHTDIHAAHGDWPVKPSPPFIPATRASGSSASSARASARSRSATAWRCRGWATPAGPATTASRGARRSAWSRRTWATRSTARFGEYAVAYARYVVKVPDGVAAYDAAPLTCAGVTTYKAVKVAGTRSSDLVAVFGVGGLGHLAIQYASIAGGRVIAVDIQDEKLDLARELGAEFTINAAKEDPVAAIRKLGGANQAIALAVSPRAFEQAYASLRRGGTLVFVALPADNEVTLPIFETVLNAITIVGSIVGRAPTCARSSHCTAPAGRRSSARSGHSSRSTRRSPISRPAGSQHESCSSPSHRRLAGEARDGYAAPPSKL